MPAGAALGLVCNLLESRANPWWAGPQPGRGRAGGRPAGADPGVGARPVGAHRADRPDHPAGGRLL